MVNAVQLGNNEYDLAHGLYGLYFRSVIAVPPDWPAPPPYHLNMDIVKPILPPASSAATPSIGHNGIRRQSAESGWSGALDGRHSGTNGHSWVQGMLDAWCVHGDARHVRRLMSGEHMSQYLSPTPWI